MRCPTCGQENVPAALVCEFCKEVLRKPARSAARASPDAPLPSRSTGPLVVGVAALSFGLGFGLRGLVWPAVSTPPPPIVIALPPPPPPIEKPAAPKPPPPLEEEKLEPVVLEPAPAAPSVPAPAPKRITIPYEHLEGMAQRIIIPVTVNGTVTVRMALDTGAPGTFISSRLAQRLGVLKEGDGRLITVAAGIGGNTAATLIVLDSIAVREARTEFVPATVTESLSDAWEGLVGMDFLAGYAVSIDTAQHVLVLTEQPATDRTPAGHDEAWWRRTYNQLAGQRTAWKAVRATLEERTRKSEVSAGGEAESLQRLLAFAQAQDREADVLASRLDRYASEHSVPLEWRRP